MQRVAALFAGLLCVVAVAAPLVSAESNAFPGASGTLAAGKKYRADGFDVFSISSIDDIVGALPFLLASKQITGCDDAAITFNGRAGEDKTFSAFETVLIQADSDCTYKVEPVLNVEKALYAAGGVVVAAIAPILIESKVVFSIIYLLFGALLLPVLVLYSFVANLASSFEAFLFVVVSMVFGGLLFVADVENNPEKALTTTALSTAKDHPQQSVVVVGIAMGLAYVITNRLFPYASSKHQVRILLQVLCWFFVSFCCNDFALGAAVSAVVIWSACVVLGNMSPTAGTTASSGTSAKTPFRPSTGRVVSDAKPSSEGLFSDAEDEDEEEEEDHASASQQQQQQQAEDEPATAQPMEATQSYDDDDATEGEGEHEEAVVVTPVVSPRPTRKASSRTAKHRTPTRSTTSSSATAASPAPASINLEAMDNKELYAFARSFGINRPVTSLTRGQIIRKLRALQAEAEVVSDSSPKPQRSTSATTTRRRTRRANSGTGVTEATRASSSSSSSSLSSPMAYTFDQLQAMSDKELHGVLKSRGITRPVTAATRKFLIKQALKN